MGNMTRPSMQIWGLRFPYLLLACSQVADLNCCAATKTAEDKTGSTWATVNIRCYGNMKYEHRILNGQYILVLLRPFARVHALWFTRNIHNCSHANCWAAGKSVSSKKAISITLSVQITKIWGMYSFYIRNRKNGSEYILSIWVFGPLG